MIYLVVAGDYKKRLLHREKYLRENFIISNTDNLGEFANIINSVSLFGENQGIVFQDFFLNIGKDLWNDAIKIAKDSGRDLIFEESSTEAGLIPLVKKNKIEVIELKEKEYAKYNAFAITDAYANGEKKELFTLFMESLIRGEAGEEIHGRLVWIAKTLSLISQSEKLKNQNFIKDINPFVVSKNKKFVDKQKTRDFLNEYKNLILVSHNAHRGEGDILILLEQFILEVF